MNHNYCMKCMNPVHGTEVCPFCGYAGEDAHAPHILRPGTVLKGRYLLGEPLGQGGFGITYIGRDLMLNMRIAVKEYFPSGYANRNVFFSDHLTITDERLRMSVTEGKDRFLKEAQILAMFHDEHGIVDVRDYFEENNTAYIVMEYLSGDNLSRTLKTRLFSADQIFSLMKPVFDTLEKIHAENVIHRDISPDNIMILSDGSLKLMDFGAARMANFSDEKSLSVMLKPGYAPVEQFSRTGSQGPWTDIYALCATIYKCITGITPPDSPLRVLKDEIKWPSELNIPISRSQENVLKQGMSVRVEDRFPSIKALKAALKELPEEQLVLPVTVTPKQLRKSASIKIQDKAILNSVRLKLSPDMKDGTRVKVKEADLLPAENGAKQALIAELRVKKSTISVKKISILAASLIAFAAVIAATVLITKKAFSPSDSQSAETQHTDQKVSQTKNENTAVPDETDKIGEIIQTITPAPIITATPGPTPSPTLEPTLEPTAVPEPTKAPTDISQFTYEENDHGGITITKYTGSDETVIIPQEIDGLRVTEIGGGAFIFNETLSSIVLPEGLLSIGTGAFSGCTSLSKIDFPDSLVSIGGQSFLRCSFHGIILPEGLTSIGNQAFADCDRLNSIVLPSTLQTITGNPFNYCRNLKMIVVADGNPNYYDEDGVLMNHSGTLICYPPGKTDTAYTVPSGTVTIGYLAFDRCKNLTSIVLPEGLKSIDQYAFFLCDHLKTVSLPNGLQSIGTIAFYGCALTQIDIPDSVRSIGSRVFERTDISSITVNRNCVFENNNVGKNNSGTEIRILYK